MLGIGFELRIVGLILTHVPKLVQLWDVGSSMNRRYKRVDVLGLLMRVLSTFEWRRDDTLSGWNPAGEEIQKGRFT